MQPGSPAATRYEAATIAFHWLTALLVVGQWVGAQVIDWFPPGPLRVNARSVHIVAGALLAALLLARVGWRATRGRRLPLADGAALSVVAKGTHWTLYGLLATMVALGFLLTWARGDSLFNLVTIPRLGLADHDTADQLQDWHNAVGFMILVLAGLHAAAALLHRYAWKDLVLVRHRNDDPPWMKDAPCWETDTNFETLSI